MNNSIADQTLHVILAHQSVEEGCRGVGPGEKPATLHNNSASHGTTHVHRPIAAEQHGIQHDTMLHNASRHNTPAESCGSLHTTPCPTQCTIAAKPQHKSVHQLPVSSTNPEDCHCSASSALLPYSWQCGTVTVAVASCAGCMIADRRLPAVRQTKLETLQWQPSGFNAVR